jgi:hypothetical protein
MSKFLDAIGLQHFVSKLKEKYVTQSEYGLPIYYVETGDVPSGGNYQQKTVSPTEAQQVIEADTGYDALERVTVSAVDSSYVGTGVTRRTSSDLTASGATVTVPSGFYASQSSKAVSSGTEGTPTATKGSVSNHAVTVTPSVTNGAGYISGGTKTGTGVYVSASELVSGSQTIEENGTFDVTNLASIIVAVTGGGGLEYESGTWEPASDIARGSISFTNSHSEAPAVIVLSDATGTAHSATNSNYVFVWFDYYKLDGKGVPYSSSGFRYATAFFNYRGSSTSSISTGGYICSQNSGNTSSSGASYPRYWASPTGFHPYTNSTSRYWRAGRTYKWLAIWKP